MPISFDPQIRLEHLADYVRNIHLNLPYDEALIQLLRCRLVGYRLVLELKKKGLDKKYIDDLMAEAYRNLRKKTGKDAFDPYEDPCSSQYMILDELRSYAFMDMSDPFMIFLRAEFKKVFVPTLRILTDLCTSKNKYSWEEVKVQLQEIMTRLEVDVEWEECESHLEKYLNRIAPLFE